VSTAHEALPQIFGWRRLTALRVAYVILPVTSGIDTSVLDQTRLVFDGNPDLVEGPDLSSSEPTAFQRREYVAIDTPT
jgi:hypothetical protein